jgi:hypothetical protein
MEIRVLMSEVTCVPVQLIDTSTQVFLMPSGICHRRIKVSKVENEILLNGDTCGQSRESCPR